MKDRIVQALLAVVGFVLIGACSMLIFYIQVLRGEIAMASTTFAKAATELSVNLQAVDKRLAKNEWIVEILNGGQPTIATEEE